MVATATSMAETLSSPTIVRKLGAGRLYRSELDIIVARHDAGSWLMLAAALTGAETWTLDRAELERRGQVCQMTITRGISHLIEEGLWVRVGYGIFAKGDAWPEPSEVWVDVGPELAAALEDLGAHPKGLSALRLGLYVVPRLRGARAAKAHVCSLTNDRIAGELKMGRSQISEGLRRLEPKGLRCVQSHQIRAVEEGFRLPPRIVSTSSAPWSHEAPPAAIRTPGRSSVEGPPNTLESQSEHTGTEGGSPCTAAKEPSTATRASARKGAPSGRGFEAGRPTAGELAEAAEEAPRPAGLERVGGGPVSSPRRAALNGPAAEAAALLSSELGLEGRRLDVLALVAGSEARARLWLEGEGPMLNYVRSSLGNAAGWFWVAFRDYDSRPGFPSDAARRRRRELEQARRLDAWHGRHGLETPAPEAEIPEGLRDWYQAQGLVTRLEELLSPAAGGEAALERRICREVLGEIIEDLVRETNTLPRYHAEELDRWRRALELSREVEKRRELDALEERRQLESYAAAHPEVLKDLDARESSTSSPTSPATSRSSETSGRTSGEKLRLGGSEIGPAELRALGAGNAYVGLRLWLAGKGQKRLDYSR